MSAAPPPTAPAAEQPGTPPPAASQEPTSSQQGRFEDFLSESIGAALKENPKLPSLEKEAPTEPEPTKTVEPAATEPQPGEAISPLIPDFSKLAFGKDAAEKIPATPQPVETPVLDQFPEKFPGKSTPQGEQAWASLRKANKALFEQNADLTTKLKEAQTRLKDFDGKTPMDREEFGRLTSERDTLASELKLSKLEATPEYKKAITQPWAGIEDQMRRLSAKYGVNEHQIRKAITEADQDKQSELLGQITETFNDRDKLTLFKVADSAVEIARKREVLHKDVTQALGYIEAKRNADAEAQAAAFKTEWTGSLTKAWDTVGEALYLARPIPGNDEWNKGLNESKQLVATTNLSSLPPLDQAKIMVQAAILPRACMAIAQLWNMYNEASTALKRYQGVTPGAGSGSSGIGTEPIIPQSGDEVGFVDAIESRMGSGRR